jgi:hypothetical protein
MTCGSKEHIEEALAKIAWRREKVLDLSSKGYSGRDIAKIFQISHPTIVRDVQYLRRQAKDNIAKYIDEQLPAEYHKCLVGVTAILKDSWYTAAKAESEGDRREQLQALTLAKECYAMKLDLLSSATVVDRALKFVEYHRMNNVSNNKPLPLISQNGDARSV